MTLSTGVLPARNKVTLRTMSIWRDAEFEVHRWELLNRHALSPYAGRKLRGKVVRTMICGQTLFLHGKIVATRGGNLLKPAGKL